MAKPKRVRGGVAGHPTPPGAVFVGRGTKTEWYSRFDLGKTQVRMPAIDGGEWEHEGRLYKASGEKHFFCTGFDEKSGYQGIWVSVEYATPEQCYELCYGYFTGTWERSKDKTEKIKAELRGKDLACRCPLSAPYCHADVLLDIANSD